MLPSLIIELREYISAIHFQLDEAIELTYYSARTNLKAESRNTGMEQ